MALEQDVAEVDRLLAAANGSVRRVFRSVVTQLEDALPEGKLVELIASGQHNRALDEALAVAAQLGDSSTLVFATAGQSTARFLSRADVGTVTFDAVNPRAVDAMRRNKLRLVQGLTSDVQASARSALLDAVSRGLPPLDTARRFRSSLGLTPRQLSYVASYRRLLENRDADALNRALRDRRFDASLLRSIRTDEPLSASKVDAMVERYRQRWIRYRSEVIARTESLRAVHQGMDEAMRQVLDAGTFAEDELERKWVSARDKRVRDSHVRLNGTRRKINETFLSDSGPLRYPGDPEAAAEETVQCRCVLVTRVK